ncbi:isoflavone reductase family protein CipA, putative [Talaromyces stipitatus ATCC 10500]|uniref:Isoflavone reductase family protein CipA, putative n=1 Tax=Talaromyces stipitatus (strain ATCC 10500 / CBS 375.48 / QM 6759 / NRRL 1006) TaxID=441959 RepID=B8MRX8_TALSN|nr:isoflavone reductase family protein CipA, putative [Talaromyces stipitatus ATCC 10500]EED13311.1 isoflavone reductase family protein CipA, putative [Talaromyces stipitatus ATCC 10500]
MITKVVLAGATGSLGSQTLVALLNQGFKVTVLTRTPKEFPAGVAVKVVDFGSTESLAAAVTGQDAVIDNTFTEDIETPLRLIDAAAASGVYRFVTSDYGLDPEIPGVRDMPVFARKRESYRAVKEQVGKSGMTYTLIVVGCFLDWCLSNTFAGIDLKAKSATLFDSGDNVVPWTTLEDAGKATAGALLRPEETLNRPVYVHSAFLSQIELLRISQDVLGKGGWNTTCQEMQPLLDQALADLRSGNITPMTFGVQIQYCIAKRSLAHPWERDDNSLVGVEEKTNEELKALVRQLIAV